MEETIHCFQRLGLTQYESASLSALFSRHDATAQEVAEIAGMDVKIGKGSVLPPAPTTGW